MPAHSRFSANLLDVDGEFGTKLTPRDAARPPFQAGVLQPRHEARMRLAAGAPRSLAELAAG